MKELELKKFIEEETELDIFLKKSQDLMFVDPVLTFILCSNSNYRLVEEMWILTKWRFVMQKKASAAQPNCEAKPRLL